MKWDDKERSSNVEDRRGQPGVRNSASMGKGLLFAQLFRFLPFLLKSKMGRLVLLGAALFFGYQTFMGQGPMVNMPDVPVTQRSGNQALTATETGTPTDENAQFVATILATTETVWGDLLPNGYKEPILVLYTGSTMTGCGVGRAVTGPFYCPADQKVYLDLSFMQQLKQLGAPGDFAFAYVIAHEVGHHVQTLLGTSAEVRRLQQQSSKTEANELSVSMELQADCYAGVWGYYVNNEMQMLEPGDMEEGIAAASAVGDDRLQEMAGQSVQPDSFTHGSSEQRVAWFKKGFETGDPNQCQTFNGG